MIGKLMDLCVSRPGAFLATDAGMKWFGMQNAMHLARLFNRVRYARRWRRHRKAFQHRWGELLRDNGGAAWPPLLQMPDGWAIDTSHSLPHLDRLLEAGAAIIRERGGRTHADVQYPFIRGLLVPDDLRTYPAILDFITSSEILATAGDYLQ